MIVDEEVALARLESKDNLVNKLKKAMEDSLPEDIPVDTDDELIIVEPSNVEIQELYKNRTGPKGIPPMIQTLAVEHAAVSSERSAAATFGVSHQTVNYYKHEGKQIDRSKVQQRIDQVHTDAVDAMLTSIGLIKDKLPTVKKAIDLSKIAADMSRVIEKTSPKDIHQNQIKVVVFAPPIKGEAEYEEIEITSLN